MADAKPRIARQAVRLVEEIFAIAGRGLRILVNAHDDCLNVLVAPTLACREMADRFEPLEKRRRVRARRRTTSPVPSPFPTGVLLLSLQSVALVAEVIDLGEHPVEQRLG